MYQWKAPNKLIMCLPDTKRWLDYHVDTSEIDDVNRKNPSEMIYKSKEYIVDQARVGQFELTQDHLMKLDNLQQLDTNEDQE